jgi:hypothetical protein
MNPLLKRLSALRLKVRLLEGWQGICALVALILGVSMLIGVLDYFTHLPTLIRALALVSLLVGSGAVFYRFLVLPFGKQCDNLNLALRVEEAYPELNDSLATTVQFLTQSDEDLARVGGSRAMRDRTVEDTIEKASQCDFSRILDRRGALIFGAAAVTILVGAGLLLTTQREYSRIAFLRFIEPFGEHTWTQVHVARIKNEKIEIVAANKPETVAIKQAYHIKVNLSGQLPEKLKTAKIEIDGQIRTDSTEPIIREDGAAYFIKRFDMSGQTKKFKYKIVYNDGAFPPRSGIWHEVEVKPEPRLVPLDNQPSPQITLLPPAYTDLPAEKHLPAGMSNMEMYAGTKVRFRAKADRPLKDAYLAFQTNSPAVFPAALFASVLGQANPLAVAARAAAEQSLWTRIPITLEDDKSVMTARFTPWLDGKYVLVMTDDDELEGRAEGDIRVLSDPLPRITIRLPGSSVTAIPDGKIHFKYNVTDELFGIKSVYAEVRRKNADGNEDNVLRIPLYDAKGFGKLIPDTFSRLGYAAPGSLRTHPKLAVRGDDLRLRFKKLDVDTIWSLRKQFREGDVVTVEICAEDFCDVYSKRDAGRSTAIEIQILSVRQVVQKVETALSKIENDVRRAKELQEKALNTVKDVQKKDKLDQNDINNFIDNAENPQRQVREIIGNTPKEGLRGDLAELRKTLNDNNLGGTQAARDVKRYEGALDNIANGELQKLEPQIADVRNEMTQNNKNTPESKKKLDNVAKLENRVLESLKELIQQMDPTAKMNDQKNKLRDIIDREKANLKELEEMKADKQNLEKQFPDKLDEIDKIFKEKVGQKVLEQRELAQQTEKLIQEMKAELEEQQKLGNKENAEKLKEAIERLEKPKLDPMKQAENKLPINTQMNRNAQELQNQSQPPQKNLDQQKAIIDQLENSLGAMEGRNEDMTRQEIQERKDAEKRIDDLNKKTQKLREDFKKAELLEDMEEKLKKKEELAAQHEKLVDEIEKTRRELARLQEQRAANELNQAADEVDKARQKVQNGGDPDQDLKNAQAKLDRAKEDLKESEEQLARELLIKIADQLKGLKERQDAVLQRSEDFHPKVIRLKSWTDALLDTIGGNVDAQKDIAEETDGLKTKLKEAKVFHSILERAKKSMDDAEKLMKTRQTEGVNRRRIDEGNGELLTKEEIADENEWQADTVKNQKDASKRLDRILEAIKEEIAKPRPKKKDDQNAQNEDQKPKDQDGGLQAQDGIPPKAQLKALHAEQMDLKERTEEFAKNNPDRDKLTDAQKREVRELAEEQDRLQTLFGELVAPPQVPMPEEGEKKK